MQRDLGLDRPRIALCGLNPHAGEDGTIGREEIEIPSIYFSHPRRVFLRDGMLLSEHEHNPTKGNETVEERTVRFRTVGDITCTAPVESTAATLDDIVKETRDTRITERGATRLDGQTNDAAMELRKKEGYF